jgi:hypothetical protein
MPAHHERLRPFALVFALSVVVLFVTGPAAEAQRQPDPCAPFKPCTPVIGPWVTAPPEIDEIWNVICPQASPYAVGADATFPDVIYPVALVTGGEAPAPGSSELTFSVFPFNVRITFRPSAGCAPAGATLASFRQAAAAQTSYRTRVRQAPLQPGGAVRLRLGCRPGERLVHSGSGVGFYTERPPSPTIVRSLEHRHLRTRMVARTFVGAPSTVGDDERVEVRLTTFCSPAREGAADGAQTAQSDACEQWAPCTAATGPWVTTPSDGDATYFVGCRPGTVAVGSDAAFPGAIDPVGIVIGGGLYPGSVRGFFFGVLPTTLSITYQPVVGCSPSNATVAPARLVSGAATRMLRYVRTRRVRPGEAVRVRLGCRRGTRLVYSGSGVAFFTERPPSRRVVRSLRHRHRRSGSVSRTFVAAPRSVGDDERVEVQVSALCSAR